MNEFDILLIGAGGHAHACIDVIESRREYRVAGLVGSPSEIDRRRFGYLVIGCDRSLSELAIDYKYALVAVGHISNPAVRKRLFSQLIGLGFELPVIVASTAYVSKFASLGVGSIVMHGAIINAGASIGNNCIINTRAVVEHGAKVGAHCHISTGAILNGDVRVGDGSFVGSGCTVREGISIGQNVLVGMGLSVRHPLADGVRFVGVGKS